MEYIGIRMTDLKADEIGDLQVLLIPIGFNEVNNIYGRFLLSEIEYIRCNVDRLQFFTKLRKEVIFPYDLNDAAYTQGYVRDAIVSSKEMIIDSSDCVSYNLKDRLIKFLVMIGISK
jgi:hypothetical protein